VNQGPAKCTEIGNFYFKRKNYKAALSRYQEAADADPHYAPAYLGLGKAYEKLGRDQKALESYRKYLDMLPSDKDAENAKEVQRAIARLNADGARGH
jgi:tetratricopeptide (TPR) repeat protein